MLPLLFLHHLVHLVSLTEPSVGGWLGTTQKLHPPQVRSLPETLTLGCLPMLMSGTPGVMSGVLSEQSCGECPP